MLGGHRTRIAGHASPGCSYHADEEKAKKHDGHFERLIPDEAEESANILVGAVNDFEINLPRTIRRSLARATNVVLVPRGVTAFRRLTLRVNLVRCRWPCLIPPPPPSACAHQKVDWLHEDIVVVVRLKEAIRVREIWGLCIALDRIKF